MGILASGMLSIELRLQHLSSFDQDLYSLLLPSILSFEYHCSTFWPLISLLTSCIEGIYYNPIFHSIIVRETQYQRTFDVWLKCIPFHLFFYLEIYPMIKWSNYMIELFLIINLPKHYNYEIIII